MNNLLEKTRTYFEYLIKKLRNKPDRFLFINEGFERYVTVTPVGIERNVEHLLIHDMMEHAVNCQMTDLKYLERLDVDAVNIIRTEHLDEYNGKTYYQPLKILF